jgi:hypothetical protein
MSSQNPCRGRWTILLPINLANSPQFAREFLSANLPPRHSDRLDLSESCLKGNRAAELQMPLVNLTDIEIHFNFAGIG